MSNVTIFSHGSFPLPDGDKPSLFSHYSSLKGLIVLSVYITKPKLLRIPCSIYSALRTFMKNLVILKINWTKFVGGCLIISNCWTFWKVQMYPLIVSIVPRCSVLFADFQLLSAIKGWFTVTPSVLYFEVDLTLCLFWIGNNKPAFQRLDGLLFPFKLRKTEGTSWTYSLLWYLMSPYSGFIASMQSPLVFLLRDILTTPLIDKWDYSQKESLNFTWNWKEEIRLKTSRFHFILSPIYFADNDITQCRSHETRVRCDLEVLKN